MKDEFRDPSLEAASQKSVTDWLMQVISGKKPIGQHINDGVQGETQPEPEATPAETVQSAVVIENAPRNVEPEHLKSSNGIVGARHEFTAEDLCGPPVLPIIPVIREVKPPQEEITAEDLCWVPKGHELKPQPAAAQAEEERAQVPEALEVTAADISRDLPPEMMEPGDDAIEAILRRLEQAQHQVTAADISREPDDYAEELAAAEKIADELKARLGLTAGAVSAEPMAGESQREMHPPAESEAEPEAMAEPEAIAVPVELELRPEAHQDANAAEVEGAVDEAALHEAGALHEESAPEIAKATVAEEIAAAHIPDEQDGARLETPESTAGGEAAAMEDASLQAEPHAEDATGAEEQVPSPEMAASAAVSEDFPQAPRQATGPQVAGAVESVFSKEDVWKRGGMWREPTPAEAAAREDVFQGQAFREQAKNFPEEGMYPAPDELKDLDTRTENWHAAWKTLLGPVLPWLARALPMLEASAGGEQSSGLVREVRHEVAGIRLVQYEIKTAVQDHSLQLKRMEEQLTRLRESAHSPDNDGLTERVESTAKLMRLGGIGLGALLLVLLIMVGVLLARGH